MEEIVKIPLSKGDIMRMVYTEEELRKVDSATPMVMWDTHKPLYHVMDYNQQGFGEVVNLWDKAVEKRIDVKAICEYEGFNFIPELWDYIPLVPNKEIIYMNDCTYIHDLDIGGNRLYYENENYIFGDTLILWDSDINEGRQFVRQGQILYICLYDKDITLLVDNAKRD